jgi:hypothetical protein
MENHLEEGYGDPHLHYEGIKEHDTHSPVCKWNANNVKFYQNYVPESPLYPNRCHVEYCHPGSWQGTDIAQCNCGKIPQVVQLPQQPEVTPQLFNSQTLMYTGAGILVGLLLLFLLRKKLRMGK